MTYLRRMYCVPFLPAAYLFCTNCFLIPMRTNGCVHFALTCNSHIIVITWKKPTICIGKNKGADQLRINCGADQCLCFFYMDSTIPLLSKSKISSLFPSSETVQAGLCQTWSEPKLLVFSRTGSDATGEI